VTVRRDLVVSVVLISSLGENYIRLK
jgi:hypothetical protein